MNVYPGPTFYNQLTSEAIEEIVREHLVAGRPVARWFFRPAVVGGGRSRW
jgi:(2Fe-2S) ferredoxin